MEKLIFTLAFITALCAVLTIGGLIVDYIFPHCKRLNSFIDHLPLMNEEEEDKYSAD